MTAGTAVAMTEATELERRKRYEKSASVSSQMEEEKARYSHDRFRSLGDEGVRSGGSD